MAWQQLKIHIAGEAAEQLADALLDQGALSAGIEDRHAGTAHDEPLFGEPGMPAQPLWQDSTVTALFAPDADVAAVIAAVTEMPLDWSVETLEDEDWVRRTQSQFDPIRVGERLWIVPSWHAAPDADAVNLILDPGLAFGTGSHPTTRLCLEWLQRSLAGGEQVLDYGCGSGILAIAAARLGAGAVHGVDIDPLAVEAARANAARNGVTASFGLPQDPAPTGVDVLVANILANPLRALAPLLAGRVRTGGQLALSGILTAQAEALTDIYAPWFDLAPAGECDGWVCLAGVRRPT